MGPGLQHREYDLNKDSSYGGRIGGSMASAHTEDDDKRKWKRSKQDVKMLRIFPLYTRLARPDCQVVQCVARHTALYQ